MTPERWKQIADLYNSVVDSGQEERATLLAQASPEVRSTVFEMLRQQSAENILDRPAWEGADEFLDPVGAALAVGSHVGPYKIEGVLGEGGMGAVYRAHDSRLRREVAIKILPPALAGDPERLRRFEQEAWAAGSGMLIQTLMRHNLIDEYLLMIHPLVLGTGHRLFADGVPPAALRLVDSTTTTTGVLIATYQPA